ncbi:MAG: M48 family metalloprotease, partial [bacterium]|nr:M48 family metalloprotease [bacterium]
MNDITERRQRLEECLDRAFKTPVVKEKKNPLYTLSLFFVTLVMVLLPILYLGIIAGAVYGVYWHIVTNYTIFDGRVSRGRIFVFIAPIIVGGILIFFLFKPLLVRQRAKWNRILLDKEKEPFLFRVVYKMCDYLGAKRPDKLYIDNEVNAYASHRVGLTGILFNKIDLGIGMPFIEGLSFNQLMGVLAHEFGHFRQGFACRLTGISMAVNHWLYRVVYERDHWDETLDEHLKDENSSGWVMSIGYIVKLFIWISRRVLWLLMLLGHLVSHFALRQLEYDADRSEAFLVGTQTMEDTFYRARELSLASQSATENIFRQLHEGRAPEDYTGVINYFAGKFNDKDSAANRKAVLEETAGFFSTHPAPAKRIAKAKETGFNGILNKEFSNNILLTNQETIRKDLTRQMYQHWKVDKAVLDSPLDMNAFIALQRKQELADNAFTEIFETYISRHNLLFYSPDVAEEELIGSPEETVRAVRAQLKEKAEECEKNFKAINKEIKLLDKTNLALLLLDLDVKVPTEAWGLGNDEEQLKKDKVEIEQRLLAL